LLEYSRSRAESAKMPGEKLRPQTTPFPKTGTSTLAIATSSIVEESRPECATGEITPDEAAALSTLVSSVAKAVAAYPAMGWRALIVDERELKRPGRARGAPR
jgi:hypothetical protein